MVNEPEQVITVVYSPAPRVVKEISLSVNLPCTVQQALLHSGLLNRHPDMDTSSIVVGIWGRKASLQQLLQAMDRVEIYRPLRVDPKVARRERFEHQGARATGLFKKRQTPQEAV